MNDLGGNVPYLQQCSYRCCGVELRELNVLQVHQRFRPCCYYSMLLMLMMMPLALALHTSVDANSS
jgi:hypothetical protein